VIAGHERVALPDAPPALRVLVLSESLPHPALKGGDVRTWRNINALSGFARVGVFGLCSNDVRGAQMPGVPLEHWITSRDRALAFPPPKGVRLEARAWLLDPAGHPSDLYFSPRAAEEIARLLDDFRPDVVLVEGLWLHTYLDVVRAAGCRTILDCHNVEAAVFRELAGSSHGQGLEARVVRDVLPARTEAIERRAVGLVDQVWVCSDEDEGRLRELYRPTVPVVVVPNAVRLEPDDVASDGARRTAARELTVVFPGFFAYAPNAKAAMVLIEEVFPRVAAAYEACRLVLVGAMPSPGLMAAAAADPRIVVTGAVRDVQPYLAEATAMAVPLFQGGGTRVKVIEGFAAGLPVVGTAKGVEGLGVQHGKHALVAETAGEIADAVVAIWRDAALARRLAANARALVAERFSWEATLPAIRDAVTAVAG
jgi:polysaccharide biosynthesis protein PslH